ncbi:MAG TPA: hypothetical protein VFO73_08150 [Candidatus Limnocylindrales bacterium]|nr:hypothetical protein [Candidatus Limnocylindrales bacterium]
MRVSLACASLAAMALVATTLVACGPTATAPSARPSAAPIASPSAVPTRTPAPSPTPSPTATPVPTPSPLVENPAPSELEGVWRTTDGERITLSLLADRYAISRGPGQARGKLAVRGSEIELFGSDLCVGSGIYAWAIADGVLTLTPTGEPDPCGNRLDAVAGRPYTRD